MNQANPLPDWLTHAIRYIDTWLAFQMRLTEQPGCAFAVAQGGQVICERAYGYADLSSTEPLTPQHQFRAASHSKAFTAALVMRLREQGKLRLDDPIGDHVDGLTVAVAGLTIGQLLSHSSGLTANGTDQSYWNDRAPWPDQAALREQLAQPLILEPGAQHKYSNIGYGLLGLLIEAITGVPFIRAMNDHLIAPAGLASTLPDWSETNAAPFCSGHASKHPRPQHANRGEHRASTRTIIPGINLTNALACATGFVTTVGDLAQFFGRLSPDAASLILTPASRREMLRKHWRLEPSTTESYYGFGLWISTIDELDSFGHAGSFQGYQSRTCVVPALGLSLSVMINSIDGPASSWLETLVHILHHYHQAGPTHPDLADWAGRWWNLWGPVDLVPIGDAVVCVGSDSSNPFTDPEEIEIFSATQGRFRRSEAYRLCGEPVERITAPDGRNITLRIAGDEYVTEEEFTKG